MAFAPSVHSYGDDAAATAPASASSTPAWLTTATSWLTGSSGSSGLGAWTAVVNALADPRERVAVLKAKIANYRKMKATIGVGPVGLLYDNEITKMEARLKAEQVNLRLEKAGEESTALWREQGHLLAYAGIGVVALGGAYLLVRTVRTARA